MVSLACVMLSGCSVNKVWKWIDEMDWERDDRTIRVIDFIVR